MLVENAETLGSWYRTLILFVFPVFEVESKGMRADQESGAAGDVPVLSLGWGLDTHIVWG